MAYRYGQRDQAMLFPERIDDYVGPEDPVHVYDAFVEALDFDALKIKSTPHKPGCPEYDPPTMLKILIYAYSYGIRSSRKIERALHHNLSFIWLAGGLKPDYRTIARFRRKNRKPIKTVLKQCARLCLKLNVIAGNTLFVDGSKIRANAGQAQNWNHKRCQKVLKQLDQRIDQLLKQCDQIDRDEARDESFVRLQTQLEHDQDLKTKVQNILETLEAEERKSFNTTDPECVPIKGRQGSHAGYNAQIVVDEQEGLIVHGDVVNESNDEHQFAEQIEQANDVLDQPCQQACGDAGYYDADELEKIDSQGIHVIVPPRSGGHKAPTAFAKDQFHYHRQDDCYICPEGHRLHRHWRNSSGKSTRYIAGGSVCSACVHFGVCTNSHAQGRNIIRYDNEEVRCKLASQYQEPASQEVYSRRKERCEIPFGHLKHNLGVHGFLLRGIEAVRAEMSLLCTCFNIARLIGIYGVRGILTQLS